MTTTTTAAPHRHGAALFQPHALEECPNWRFLVAYYAAQEADDEPPQHEDPWIQDTAELLYVDLHKIPDFRGTLRQRHIRDALFLHKKGPLVVKVLECLLASDYSHEEITGKCNLSQHILEAYAAILCDLSDPRSVQAWGRLQLNPRNWSRGPVGAITNLLQNKFFYDTIEGLEEAVDLLCRLEGPTLADDLPARNTPGFLRTFGIMCEFAEALLPRNKKNCHLMQRFYEAISIDTSAIPLPAEAVELGIEILRRVKISKTLVKEITQLREFWRPASYAASEA